MNKWILPLASGLTSGFTSYGMSHLGHNPLVCMVVGIWAGLTVSAVVMLLRR